MPRHPRTLLPASGPGHVTGSDNGKMQAERTVPVTQVDNQAMKMTPENKREEGGLQKLFPPQTADNGEFPEIADFRRR